MADDDKAMFHPGGRSRRALPALLAGLLLAGLACRGDAPPARPAELRFGKSRKIATLANRAIRESSGLAASRRREGLFWTHNDSGDVARLFAFDTAGRSVATVRLDGVTARDFEDLAAFEYQGRAYLLVGDIGDNDHKRKAVRLHLLAEPDLRPASQPAKQVRRVAKVLRTVEVTYPDGPHDCEALAVDPAEGSVLLITKSPRCKAYRLPLGALLDETAPNGPLPLEKLTGLPVLLPTAADLSPDGKALVVVNYWQGFLYTRSGNQRWADALDRMPRPIALPARKQGESVCFGPDSRSLYLTSEKLPTPLLVLPPAEAGP